MEKAKINHITKENGLWSAELTIDGKRAHTYDLYPEGILGLSLKKLRENLKRDYGLSIPEEKELVLFKKTQHREIFVIG